MRCNGSSCLDLESYRDTKTYVAISIVCPKGWFVDSENPINGEPNRQKVDFSRRDPLLTLGDHHKLSTLVLRKWLRSSKCRWNKIQGW